MNTELQSFLSNLKSETQVHFICDESTVIIGKFSKFEGETIYLETASVSGKIFPMGTKVDVNKVEQIPLIFFLESNNSLAK